MQLAFKGRPSKGCNKCRQRKVKCDEGHPRCDKCTKGDFDCVYKDEFDILLRNQTSETAARAQKKWRSRAKKPDDPSICPISSPSRRSGSAPPHSRSIELVVGISPSIKLDQSIYDLASKRFIFDFVIPEESQVPRTGFSFVCGFVDNMEPNTCIYHAFRATSLSNIAARSKSRQASDMASEEYGKSIKLLTPYVTDPELSPPLEVLSSVCLLSLYEVLSTPYLTHGGSWQAHVNGSCAILNSMYAKGGNDLKAISELFTYITTQMLINRMSLGTVPSIPLSTMNTFIRPKTMAAQILGMMYKTAGVLAEWRSTEMNVVDQSTLLSAAMKMVDDCDSLDEEMTQWVAEQAPIWEEETKPNKIENLPSWLQDLYSLPGAPTKLRISNSFLIAQRYGLIRGTGIQMYTHALNALDVLIASAPTDAELAPWLDTQHRLEVRLMNLINDMLSAIYGQMTLPIQGKPTPKTLDDVPTLRVYALLWPLYRASMLCARRETLAQLDTEGRRFWARSVLCWIRDEMGIKKCEALVDNIDGKFGLTFG